MRLSNILSGFHEISIQSFSKLTLFWLYNGSTKVMTNVESWDVPWHRRRTCHRRQNFFSSITDETHRCGIETGRSVMSVVWVEKPPSHQQGPGCYDAITCKGNELYLSWIGFCFMNIGKINQLKKIYGPYVLFVWHWLYMYIELIRRNYVDDIGDNVTDKLYYPEITVYNPKKNGGGCHTLI